MEHPPEANRAGGDEKPARWRLCRRTGGRLTHSVAAYDGGMDDFWLAVVWSILPTIVVCALFFFLLRGILRSDRTERRVRAQIEAQERAARGLPPRAS